MIPRNTNFNSTFNRHLFRSASLLCLAIFIPVQRFDFLHQSLSATGVASSIKVSLSSASVLATHFYRHPPIVIDLCEVT
jgi:hypothetical protein